jgi:hypothetical protein
MDSDDLLWVVDTYCMLDMMGGGKACDERRRPYALFRTPIGAGPVELR